MKKIPKKVLTKQRQRGKISKLRVERSSKRTLITKQCKTLKILKENHG